MKEEYMISFTSDKTLIPAYVLGYKYKYKSSFEVLIGFGREKKLTDMTCEIRIYSWYYNL